MLAPEKEPISQSPNERKNSKPETRRRRASSVSGVGPLNIIMRSNDPPSMDSFTKIKLLGRGDVGRVYLVEEKATGNVFAMKVLNKKEMIERNRVKRVLTEREVLATANHPFIVACYHSFMDPESIYFVLDYCAGGEFFRMLQKQPNKCISEDAARFYAAEVLLALEYLHFLGFIYRGNERDTEESLSFLLYLKPENILMDEFGHVKLTDFDLSKASASSVQSAVVKKYGKSVMVSKPEVVTNSFVGTDEYVAPEVIEGYGHTSCVDWWTLGILIYEMLFGKTPYKGKDTEDTWRNITRGHLHFPDTTAVSADAKNLIKKLLHNDAKKRLGAEHGALDIKENKWFKSISFDMILNKKPPIVPQLKSRTDTSYFRQMTEEPPAPAAAAAAAPAPTPDDGRKPLTEKDKERAESALVMAFGVLGSPRAPRPPRAEAPSSSKPSAVPSTATAKPSAAPVTASTTATASAVSSASKPSASATAPSANILTSPRVSPPASDTSVALAAVAQSSKPSASVSSPSADVIKSPRATVASPLSPSSSDKKEKEKESLALKSPRGGAKDGEPPKRLSRSLSSMIKDALVSPRSKEKKEEEKAKEAATLAASLSPKEREKEKPLSSSSSTTLLLVAKEKEKDKSAPSPSPSSPLPPVVKEKEKTAQETEKEKVSTPVRKTSAGAHSAVQHTPAPEASLSPSSSSSTAAAPHRKRSSSFNSSSVDVKADKKEKKEKKDKKDKTKEKK